MFHCYNLINSYDMQICDKMYLTGCIFKTTHLLNIRSKNGNVAKSKD